MLLQQRIKTHDTTVRRRTTHSFNEETRGFTLLFATLTSSLLLTIGLSIFNLALKENRLSGTAASSELAFASASAGVECVLYWDRVQKAFDENGGVTTNISCGGSPPIAVGGQPIPPVGKVSYPFAINTANYCIEITVDKFASATTFISRGFDTCNAMSNRRVQRALEGAY